jgi:hypothetical protein
MYEKGGEIIEKDIFEFGTCCLAFANQTSQWSFLGVTSSIE